MCTWVSAVCLRRNTFFCRKGANVPPLHVKYFGTIVDGILSESHAGRSGRNVSASSWNAVRCSHPHLLSAFFLKASGAIKLCDINTSQKVKHKSNCAGWEHLYSGYGLAGAARGVYLASNLI